MVADLESRYDKRWLDEVRIFTMREKEEDGSRAAQPGGDR
jgi:hypothetical protein